MALDTHTATAPHAPPKVHGARRSGRLAFLHLAPGMTGFLIFIVIPLLASIAISLYEWPLFGERTFVGIDNYVRLFNGDDPAFGRVLFNTAVFAICYTVGNLVLSTGIAVWLQSLPTWAPFFRILFFVPVVTPMVANALVWRVILDDNGILNATLGVIGIDGPSWLGEAGWAMTSLVLMSLWQGIGYNIVVLGAGLNTINPSVLEAARIDGAGAWKKFWRVLLPMLSPSLFFCTIMTVIGAFKVFTQPYMLTKGGPGEATNTLVLHLYRTGFSFDQLGLASAMAWVLFVIVMLVTAVQFIGQRKWVTYDA